MPLSELVTIKADKVDSAIYHKNLRPVTYIFRRDGKTQQCLCNDRPDSLAVETELPKRLYT